MRLPLIDGQGNYGSVDGDPPAAMRYTECRLADSAMSLLDDIDKDTVDFQPTTTATRRNQSSPARFPNLLANGAGGIASAWRPTSRRIPWRADRRLRGADRRARALDRGTR